MADILEGKKEENVNRFLGDAVIGTQVCKGDFNFTASYRKRQVNKRRQAEDAQEDTQDSKMSRSGYFHTFRNKRLEFIHTWHHIYCLI